MKNLFLSLMLAIGLATAAPAAMVTFDFANLAENIGEGPISTVTVDGVTLNITSTGGSPFLDDADRFNRPAGVGVCDVVGDDCLDNSDDDLGWGETLTFTVDGLPELTLVQGLFRNGSHRVDFYGNAGLSVDGATAFGFDPDPAPTVFNATGSSFTFLAPGQFQNINSTYGRKELYVEALTFEYTPGEEVPEPGTVFLFGAGLLGLVSLRKRGK